MKLSERKYRSDLRGNGLAGKAEKAIKDNKSRKKSRLDSIMGDIKATRGGAKKKSK